MDNREYLDRLVASTKRQKTTKMSFITSPIFIVLTVGIILFIILAIIGAIIGGGKNKVENQGIFLKLYLDSTLETVSEYQKSLKSSDLRSSSSALYSVVSNTNRELTDFLQTTYGYSDKSASEGVKEEIKLQNDGLNAELFEAKINGRLDRIYAHKMAYEISYITSKEVSLHNDAKNETLRKILETSHESLSNLYGKFSDFSETK